MNTLKSWALRHVQTAIGTLGRLSEQWLASSFMVLVIAIALALPACLQVVLSNVRVAGGDFNRSIELSMFLNKGTTLARAQQIAAAIRKRADIAEVRLIPADVALVEFRKHSGFGEALSALSENPLPHALAVIPVAAQTSGGDLQKLADELRAITDVEIVQLDSIWLERFNAIVDALKRASVAIGVLLGFGVIFIIGNAIRADIHTRREEIEVIKLVGASDAFVRRSFLYSGVWYGLGGGLVGLLITYAVGALLSTPVKRIAQLYGSQFALRPLALTDALSLVVIAVALGWIASFVAATRHLRAIEPK
jgi:cell division transport system permease protein